MTGIGPGRSPLPLSPLPLLPMLPVLLALLPLLAGCRGDAGDDLPVEARVSVAPTPPLVGPALVVVELTDAEGEPVDGARVQVEGTMTHAGMVPVFADAEPTGGGRYRIQEFDFTMGGDWILRVHITLPDGTRGVREREVRVVSGAGAPG
jgi:hypothetical protein